ncbi:MAG: EAL domain-containing protein, partial [Clostridia bacterium]|nr:EAL domain-containing protein [Clostridia bacterium]
IPKPYPQPEVILARIQRTIELSEDREISQSTARDPLTGLYNREFFSRYAEQYDQHHRETPTDAIVVDVHHFHMINERYGKGYGDEVLRRIGEKLRSMVGAAGGIICRRESDTFMVYCPHREDYQQILESASIGLAGDESATNRIRLRMGVYSEVDKAIDIERRFDRAKMAADTLRGNFVRNIAYYDNTLHEKELYNEQLLEEFPRAIKEHQFCVFYQPKFDIRPEIPVLASAEALVRWRHPEMGLISPGVFIPLFEENGMIQQLDEYVWREAAAQIRDWKERLGFSIPVSVNVSRIDMYDPNLIQTFQKLLEDYGLTPDEMLLEITESAYTQDSEQIIQTVNTLRELGFSIEMDDFGTGYSSLNMISVLPIDALKLDMQFIRSAFRDHKDTRLLEVIIDIADYLTVPVIAEGVETEEQLHALKAMGCDIVQGYYFSRPVPADEYEHFLEERKAQGESGQAGIVVEDEHLEKVMSEGELAFGRVAHALSSGFESIYYIDTANDHYLEFSAQGKYEDLQIQRSGSDFFADTLANIPRVVYAEDQDRLALSMKKDVLLTQLEANNYFSMTYRLVIGGVPLYYNLKAVRAYTHDDHHIVIGVSNIDSSLQVKLENDDETLKAGNHAFASIANALSSDYEAIFSVDLRDDSFTLLTSQGAYERMGLGISDGSFFERFQEDIAQAVEPDDRQMIAKVMQRDELLECVEKGNTFSVVFRLRVDDVPTYYRLMATFGDEEHSHLVVGISNIAAQVAQRRESEAMQQNSVMYARIAQALSQDYFSIYYVNIYSNDFIEYATEGENHEIVMKRTGGDFFDDCKRAIPEQVVPEDQEIALKAFEKDTLVAEVASGNTFSIAYRLKHGDEPRYCQLKALKLGDDEAHIIIGVSDIEAQMQRQKEYEASKAESLTYSRIAHALARDYFSIYYVNIETDAFEEYSSSTDYQELHIEKEGMDFFETTRKNIMRLVFPADKDKALSVWTKERLIPELTDGRTFSTTYRLLLDGTPTYINCKVIRMHDSEDANHIVIGVSNVDAQMKREAELNEAKAKANRDALTGVKSKHAYVEAEEEYNQRMEAGDNQPFAVVLCDVNGLKQVNDTLGHQAGDKFIQDACHEICTIFKHSPVFRIGGDEFVAILRGDDFAHREELMETLHQNNIEQGANGGVVIASGLSVCRLGVDKTLGDVFERADKRMYENKQALKAGRN